MDSAGPKYRQIADHLRTLILDGTLAPGDPIPSTDQLRRQFGVTVSVASQARQVLVSECSLSFRIWRLSWEISPGLGV